MFPGHGGTGRLDAHDAGVAPEAVLDVSASLSPLGPPLEALAAYRSAADALDRYPEIDAASLRRGYARLIGRRSDEVLAGAGSTEFVYLTVRTLRPTAVRTFQPTYGDYEDAARVAGVPFRPIPTDPADAFARRLDSADNPWAAGDLLVLCNPNNPTGNRLRPDGVLAFARARPDVFVMVDEAYAGFVGPEASVLAHLDGEEDLPANLGVLQSPTKLYALPGLRLGYCVAHPSVAGRLLDAKEPWTVSAPALAVGLALLDCDAWARRVRETVLRARAHLVDLLIERTPAEPLPSEANFLLLRLPDDGPDAGAVRAACLREGVAVRDCTNFAGLGPRYIRIAVRTDEENERVVAALAAALPGADAARE